MSAEKVFLKGNMAKAAKMYNDNEAEISGGGITDMVSRFLEKTVNPYLSKQLKQQYADKAKAKDAPKATPAKVVPVKSKLHPSAKRVPSGNVGIATQQSPDEGPSISSGVRDEPLPKSRPKGPPPSFTKAANAQITELENSKPPDAVATTISELEANIDAIKDLDGMPKLGVKEMEQPEPMGEKAVARTTAAEADGEADEEVEEDDNEDGDTSKPILCRTGTKKDIAWWLIERFDPVYKNTYVEAFFGGGAIFWKKPKVGKEIINEWNPLVADFYKRLQKGIGADENLMPELHLYAASREAYDKDNGELAWRKKLQEHFGKSYLSKTVIKLTKTNDQYDQIDRISRIVIPFLREHPVVTKKVEDKAGSEYDVIDRSKKGGAIDNLVCLYWYIISFCNGMGGAANIPIPTLQCLAENDKNLITKGENVAGKAEKKFQMPIKKTADPFSKLNPKGNGREYVNRLKGVTIYNDDALTICPKHDSPNTFFMLDPPYEAGGGYGITTTATADVLEGSAKPKKEKVAKPKKVKVEYPPLRPDKDNVFPFRAFVRMVDKLKGKVMVTINGSKNILELFQGKDESVKITKPYYAAKIWVSNKASKGASKSARFEIVYANYKFKDSEDINSEAFVKAPEYFIASSDVIKVEYTKAVLPYQDYTKVEGNAIKGSISFILKPKNEDKPDKPPPKENCISTSVRKPPISNSVLPFVGQAEPVEGEAPAAKAAKKPRKAKATAAPAVPVNEIVEAAPAKKPRKPRAKKEPAPAAAPAPAAEEGEIEGSGKPSGTHRANFLKTHKLEDRGYTMAELSKISAVPLETLAEVYKRGIGAYKGNPKSVRLKGSFVKGVNAPMNKKLSKEQWAIARVYSFLDGNPKHDNDLRAAGGNCGCESDYEEMTGGGFLNDDLDVAEGLIGGYYSPNRPPHLGSKYAFTPSVGYGGSEYNTMEY